MPYTMEQVVAMMYKAASNTEKGKGATVLVVDSHYEYDVENVYECEGDICIEYGVVPEQNPIEEDTIEGEVIDFPQQETG